MLFVSILFTVACILFILPQVLPRKWTVLCFFQREISIFTIFLWLSWGLLLALLTVVYGFFLLFKEAYYSDYYQFMSVVLPVNNFLIALNIAMTLSPIYIDKIFRLILMRGLVVLSALVFWFLIWGAQFTS
jgi:hypothetical protein